MATVARQPFAPLNEARLHTLTSLKNRQNAISNSSPVKRKASDVTESDDSENVDPVLFAKRAKGADSFFPSKSSFIKPPTFFMTKSASTNDLPIANAPKAGVPRSRNVLNPKSRAAKLNISIARSSPLSAPAGRSPTRGKRSGILSSRKHGSSFSRVDPPVFGLSSGSSAAPFSLDAALKGTISSYTGRSDISTSKKQSSAPSNFSGLHEPEMNSSWFFDIHEDTEEQEMTNLLQHHTGALDLSSDEESESRRQQERAEGKENIPPVDDVSQTSRPRAARLAAGADDMLVEKERNPLGEMDPKQYYAEGCYEDSIVIVEDDEETHLPNESNIVSDANVAVSVETETEADAVAEISNFDEEKPTVEDLMQKTDTPAPGAALLEPLEGTGETFEVWESSSAKDETEAATECS
ncbi:hypothetical protein NPX13_g11258 [Xylaria arbuscula]|uniref:Thymidylate kinase n=1 Tax=Xylaria arbuscula TaxID=114810 RepID=A0A9W8N381_9PEZI|nr:hypothetical protein NPX13_g11258 [Xylaria arbuscula]